MDKLGIKLEEAIAIAPQFREMVESDPGIAKLVGIAQQLEGVARNASTHAAGVVISRDPLTDLMPLQKATKCDLCTDQLGGPACQRACPHDALVRMDLGNLGELSAWVNR